MKKLKSMVIDDQEDSDRLSKLPDEIVAQILCLLTPMEAAKTCTLSKRWKNMFFDVWTSSMNLNFYFNYSETSGWRKSDKSSAKYAECVNRLLDHHRARNIDQFRVYFDLDVRFRPQINKWIKFAMKKNVKILQLYLYCGGDTTLSIPERRYGFPKRLLSMKQLGFKSLQVLEFKYVNVTGKVLENMLCQHCPALERLVVFDSRSLVNFKVVGTPSLVLKHLEIRECKHLKHVEVRDCMNLITFGVDGKNNMCDILVKNVPKLVKVFMISSSPFYGTIGVLNHLSCCLSQLEFLKLNAYGGNVDDGANPVYPVLTNLKHLELVVDVRDCCVFQQLSSLLVACPYLQRIVLQLMRYEVLNHKLLYAEAAEYPHHNLMKVKLLGYFTCAFVELFKENAAAKEIIIVFDHTFSDEEQRTILEAIEQLVKTKFPTSHVTSSPTSHAQCICL